MNPQERNMQDDQSRENSEDLPDPQVGQEQVNLDELDNRKQAREDPLEIGAICASLTIFAIFGALARIGLSGLSSYPGQSVFSTAAPQAVGCALIGLIARNRAALEQIYGPMYVGLATGLCGSITTFSTWMFDTFAAFANLSGSHDGSIRNVVDGLTNLYITFAVASAGLRFGIHTSTLLHQLHLLPKEPESNEKTPLSTRRPQRSIHLAVIAFALALWIGAAFLAGYKPSFRYVTLSLPFAPLGACLRYFLAKKLNTNASFPLGTFTANMLAAAFFAVFALLQYSSIRSTISCAVLAGMIDGFCGCLSTVSTFVTEIREMKRFHAYRYAVSSVLGGQALMVLVFGSYWWSRGLEGRCDDRF